MATLGIGWPSFGAVLVLCLATPLASAQQVEARLDRIGLTAGNQPIGRAGEWTYARVELRNRDASPFDGQLRVDQLDADGDVASFQADVALTPGGDWRTYEVYFVASGSGPVSNPKVGLFDRTGRRVTVIGPEGQPLEWLEGPKLWQGSSDTLLIVELSGGPRLPHLSALAPKKDTGALRVNDRQVMRLLPAELPTRWEGLAMVDAIVWDDADPTGLNSTQIDALIEWVTHGGRLLLTASTRWRALAASPLAGHLPAELTGTSLRREVQEFESLVPSDAYTLRLARQYAHQPILRCLMRPSPDAIPLPSDDRTVGHIGYRGLMGRGWITLLGASLRDLLPPPRRSASSAATDLFRRVACERVVARKLLGLPENREVPEAGLGGLVRPLDLFAFTRSTVGFEAVGTKFLVFAIVFASAYTFTASFGSYWYLRRRSLLHHCWSAFASVAFIGAIAGTGMVWTLRGVRTRLWQTTIVDAMAGQHEASAICFFGLKTPDHGRHDLRLPGGEERNTTGALRVTPGSEQGYEAQTHFVSPEHYAVSQADGRLTRVPVRATLKELLGEWRGPLPGTLDAKLVLRRNGGQDRAAIPAEFREGSYIRNNLGLVLEHCLIIFSDEDQAGEGQVDVALCLELGDLPTGTAEGHLDGTQIRERLYTIPRGTSNRRERLTRLPRLSDFIKGWYENLSQSILVQGPSPTDVVRRDEYALALLSVVDLVRAVSLKDGPGLTRGHGRRMSANHLLTRRTALLFGFSRQPPKPALEVDGRLLKPERSLTLYRFVIPVEDLRSAEAPS